NDFWRHPRKKSRVESEPLRERSRRSRNGSLLAVPPALLKQVERHAVRAGELELGVGAALQQAERGVDIAARLAAGRTDALRGRLEIVHLEADMVEAAVGHTALGACGGVGLEVDERQVDRPVAQELGGAPGPFAA